MQAGKTKANVATTETEVKSSEQQKITPEQIRTVYFEAIGNQFYWIAGLSIINSVLLVLNIGIYFPVGITVNYIVEELAWGIFGAGDLLYLVITLLFSIFTSGIFGFLASQIIKNKNTAFWIAISFYVIDALIAIGGAILFAYPALLLDVLFHAYMLFVIFKKFFSMSKAIKSVDGSEKK